MIGVSIGKACHRFLPIAGDCELFLLSYALFVMIVFSRHCVTDNWDSV